MKYVRSFISNTILFYLFNDAELFKPTAPVSNMYDDVEDYIMWAEKRIEVLFYACTSSSWSLAEKIRRIDKKLLTIFPFLSRIIDRSYVIERFLTALELFEMADELPQEDESTIIESEANGDMSQENHSRNSIEEDNEEDTASEERAIASIVEDVEPENVVEVDVEPESVDEEVVELVAEENVEPELVAEVDVEPESEVEEPESVAEDVEPESVVEALIEPESEVAARDAQAREDAAVVPQPERVVIPLNQSIYKLRLAAHGIGIKHAFLLTKKQAAQKLALYNAGLLPLSDLTH